MRNGVEPRIPSNVPLRAAKLRVFLPALCLALLVLTPALVGAFPSFLQTFESDPSANPTLLGTNNCGICHLNPAGGGETNRFGQEFEAAGFQITAQLRAAFPDLFVAAAPPPRPVPPSVELVLHGGRLEDGSVLVRPASIFKVFLVTRAGSTPSNADIYVAFTSQLGQSQFITSSGLWTSLQVPFLSNVAIGNNVYDVFDITIDAGTRLPPGLGFFSAALVQPGAFPLNPGNWVSNLSTATVTFSQFPLRSSTPVRDYSIPLRVKAAFNDEELFWQASWPSEEGRFHDYFRFANGVWRTEGGDHREEGRNSTLYENRFTIMVNDPNGPNPVPLFDTGGCYVTCHDYSRNMPLDWERFGGAETTKYLPIGITGILDLWHWRAHRSNPVGASDDQHVVAGTDADGDGIVDSGGGGRTNDAGTGPFQTTRLTDGLPQFMFNPDATGGRNSFRWQDIFATDLFFISRAQNAPNGIPANATAFDPSALFPEDAAVPRRVLRDTAGSQGDITAVGTHYDQQNNRWVVQLKRQLTTGNASDDEVFTPGGVYTVAFGVHRDNSGNRDHYVTLPLRLSVGSSEPADIVATRVAGTAEPDFSRIPAFELRAFLPGIVSWEVVTSPAHPGATALLQGALTCADCHNVLSSDTRPLPRPGVEGSLNGGDLETLTLRRGGVFDATPILPVAQ